jgi:hypothetical protein
MPDCGFGRCDGHHKMIDRQSSDPSDEGAEGWNDFQNGRGDAPLYAWQSQFLCAILYAHQRAR